MRANVQKRKRPEKLLMSDNNGYDDDHDDDFEEEHDHGQDGAIGSADRLLAIRH